MSICQECGMNVKDGEYHPYAACLMFKGCRDGDTVRANLQALLMRPPNTSLRELLERARTIVAVTADPNSRAPGKAAVAREVLKDIDRVLARRSAPIGPRRMSDGSV